MLASTAGPQLPPPHTKPIHAGNNPEVLMFPRIHAGPVSIFVRIQETILRELFLKHLVAPLPPPPLNLYRRCIHAPPVPIPKKISVGNSAHVVASGRMQASNMPIYV